VLEVIKFMQPRTMLIETFVFGGTTDSGIIVQHHDLLPQVLARVIATSPDCHYVKPDDVVVVPEFRYLETALHAGFNAQIAFEGDILAVLDGYDEDEKIF